ncbi:MAG: hypothetical protein GDA46_04100 [Bdellovibrionales bacterium]|nr:hypothetical protein [Bdellovibrionales bacterium]
MIFFKFYIFLLISPFTAFANSRIFEKYFVINEAVETGANTFLKELFKDEMSDLNISFSEDTDISQGKIKAKFSTSLNSVEAFSPSEITGAFDFYIEPKEGKKSEYGINFKTHFEINQTDSFFYHISDILSCDLKGAALFSSVCESIQKTPWNSKLSKVENITNRLYFWKDYLIDQIENSESEFVKEELKDWISNQIVIKREEESVSLEIFLSGFKEKFFDSNKDFFIRTKLVDFSLEFLKIQFFEERILFDIHVKKLHVMNRIKLFVELISNFQFMIENEVFAQNLGISLRQALREGKIINQSFEEVNTTELFETLGWTVTDSISSIGYDFIFSSEEEDLGLD